MKIYTMTIPRHAVHDCWEYYIHDSVSEWRVELESGTIGPVVFPEAQLVGTRDSRKFERPSLGVK